MQRGAEGMNDYTVQHSKNEKKLPHFRQFWGAENENDINI